MGAAVSINRLDLTVSKLRKAASGEKDSAAARRIHSPHAAGAAREIVVAMPPREGRGGGAVAGVTDCRGCQKSIRDETTLYKTTIYLL